MEVLFVEKPKLGRPPKDQEAFAREVRQRLAERDERGTGVSGNQALLIRRFQISKYCSTQIGDVEEPDNHEHAEDYYADFDFVWLFPANHSLNVKPLLSDSNCPMV